MEDTSSSYKPSLGRPARGKHTNRKERITRVGRGKKREKKRSKERKKKEAKQAVEEGLRRILKSMQGVCKKETVKGAQQRIADLVELSKRIVSRKRVRV